MDTWPSLKDKVEEFEAEQVTPPLDGKLDNIERQGFSLDNSGNAWLSTQGDSIREKAVFDLQPTNPHMDIKGTGQFEVWVRHVELVHVNTMNEEPKRETPINRSNRAPLPQITTAKAACVYNPGGQCYNNQQACG